MSERSDPLKNFLAGGFGGICTVLSGHPLDTIKVRLQTMDGAYRGTFHCASSIFRSEGFTGLYKGMAAPLAGVAPIFAISFFGFSIGKKLSGADKMDTPSIPRLCIAGGVAGVFSTTIMAPGERIKCLLQIQATSKAESKYKGPIDCFKQIYSHTGIRGVYKGTVATLMRDVPGSAAYFASYEAIVRYMRPKGQSRDKISLGATIFAGGTAGMFNWCVAIPFDTIKSRYQTAPEGVYKSMAEVVSSLYKENGIRSFYKGLSPVMIRAFPANAACFLGYEWSMKFFNYLY